MEIVLDKRIVSSLTFDSVPVIENGKIVGQTPNTKCVAYVVVDAHQDAPTGFALRVNKTSKTYILRLRVNSKVETISVGRHPDLLLGTGVDVGKNARLVAADLSLRVKRGENINEQKRAKRQVIKVVTLRDLFDIYLEEYRSRVKQRIRSNTILAVEKAMARLGDKLLSKPAEEVTWKDIDDFFKDKAGRQGHQTAAEQTVRWVSAVYNRHNNQLLLDALQEKSEPKSIRNPASIFSKTGQIRTRAELERDYKKKGTRKPLSNTTEGFRAWLDFVLEARNRKSSRTGADYFYTLLTLGGRKSEVRELMWLDRLSDKSPQAVNYVDLRNREVCFNKTKNDHRLVLPIPDYLFIVLTERHVCWKDSPYVFPAVSTSPLRKTEFYSDARAFLKSVREATGLASAMHDLRRTLASVVNAMALPSLMVKQLLNHRTGDVTALYAELSSEQLLIHMNRIEMTILNYATKNPLLINQEEVVDAID